MRAAGRMYLTHPKSPIRFNLQGRDMRLIALRDVAPVTPVFKVLRSLGGGRSGGEDNRKR
ncbi:hypothetical protein DDE20_04940 [Pararhodobacter oceanensis]|uniref:Uncharacterized protein n=1 Tax=Pararhodobacter oceanensis TaxID=2172121 RepID=A0A2T8HVK0_9RHOB|nr:hypothetical protein DDE20_04940 [Pararhodobacter oceanensis]